MVGYSIAEQGKTRQVTLKKIVVQFSVVAVAGVSLSLDHDPYTDI